MHNKVRPSYPPGYIDDEPPSYGRAEPSYNHTTNAAFFSSHTHTVTSQPNVVVVTHGAPVMAPAVRPNDCLCCSCLTFWCCNCLFGGIAIIFSCMSSSAADSGDIGKARTYGRVAMCCNVFGILSTLLCVIIPIMLFVVAVGSAASRASDNNDYSDEYDYEYGCTYEECGGDCCDAFDTCCSGYYSTYCC